MRIESQYMGEGRRERYSTVPDRFSARIGENLSPLPSPFVFVAEEGDR
jgi:hypothetical protein